MIKLFVMFYIVFYQRTQNLPFKRLLFNNLDYLSILNIINADANIFMSYSTVNSLLRPMKENVILFVSLICILNNTYVSQHVNCHELLPFCIDTQTKKMHMSLYDA